MKYEIDTKFNLGDLVMVNGEKPFIVFKMQAILGHGSVIKVAVKHPNGELIPEGKLQKAHDSQKDYNKALDMLRNGHKINAIVDLIDDKDLYGYVYCDDMRYFFSGHNGGVYELTFDRNKMTTNHLYWFNHFNVRFLF